MLNKHIIHLILLCIFELGNSLNILVIMPHQGKSHQLVFEPLFDKLASKGHKITFITRYPQKNPVSNRRDVDIAPDYMYKNSSEIMSFDILTISKLDQYKFPLHLMGGGMYSCEDGLSHPNYQKFLKEDNHFDVILIEMLCTHCFLGVAKKFNAPVIGLSAFIPTPWTLQWFGTSTNPAYFPNFFLDHSDKMGFFARVENTLMNVYVHIIYQYFIRFWDNYYSKMYSGIDLLENGDIMLNISLFLVNSIHPINMKTTLSPNTILISGIHVENQPIHPLPQNLETFVKEAKHGVIYMSLGSTIFSNSLPEAKKQAFLKAFSRLSQRVILKWEGEIKDKPDNLMTVRWAPQRDILCHPNVVVFISHSGALGTIEAIDCGIPILMIPLFADQFTNAANVEQHGGGLTLVLRDINEDVIYDSLQKLLSPKFKKSSKELSNIFKDKPMSAMDTAIYWIEYVHRHKGAHFLKLASVDMPLYQYFLLDVIAFIFVVIIIYLYVTYLFVKFVFKKLSRRQGKLKKS